MIGDADLARRLEAFQAEVGMESGQDVLRVGEGAAVFAGVGSPLTQAVGVDSDVERIERFFFDRGADSVIQATPWSPRKFLDELASRRYAIYEFENVFAFDLARRNTVPPVSRTIIPEVRRAADLDLWARIGAEAFATPEMPAEMLATIIKPFGRAEHARCYIAYVDGAPAGSAAMFVSPARKVVGLFGAGTLPPFRRRGIQSALLQRRLDDAAGEGCDLAMVTTLPGSDSHRNVARRGFELLYTKASFRLAFTG